VSEMVRRDAIYELTISGNLGNCSGQFHRPTSGSTSFDKVKTRKMERGARGRTRCGVDQTYKTHRPIEDANKVHDN
jgi:hypothetical protein